MNQHQENCQKGWGRWPKKEEKERKEDAKGKRKKKEEVLYFG